MLIRMRISATILGEAVPEWISCAKGCEMINNSDDVVKVATGTLIEMTSLAELLKDEGIVCRVVGDDLTAGLGSTMPGSVELWVGAADANRANKILFDTEGHHKKHGKPLPNAFPHPKSDSKPDRTQGPHYNPEPHRPGP